MKRIRGRHLWGGLVLLLAALLVGGYAFADALLNDLLRPRLAALAAERLTAEVAIGRLRWQDGALQVDELDLQRPGHYVLKVPQLRLELALGDLLRRRVSGLEIDSPTLLLQRAADKQPAAAGGFLAHPPFTIARLAVRNGRLEYTLPTRTLLLRQLAADVDNDGEYRYVLQAVLGEDTGIPLRLVGRADWRQGLQLTLQRFDWAERSILADPLTLTLPAADGVAGGGRLRLARFDRNAFDQLQAGLQLPQVLPSDWDFELQGADIAFQVAAEQLQLQLRLAEGRMERAGLAVPLTDLELALHRQGAEWRGRGAFRLAGDSPGEVTGRWSAKGLQGQVRLQVADPGRLKGQLLGGARLAVTGGLKALADFSATEKALQLRLELQGVAGGHKSKDALFDLTPVRLQAELQRPATGGWAGSARLASRSIELGAMRLEGLNARLGFKGEAAGPWTGRLSLTGRRLSGAGAELAEMTGSTRLRFQQGRLFFSDAAAAGRLVGPGQVAGRLTVAGSGSWRAERWQGRIAALEVRDLELLSADGLAGLAGGQVALRGQVAGGAGLPLLAELQAELAAAEALWGEYYADLAGLPARVEARLNWSPASRRWQAKQWAVSLAQVGTLQGRGLLAPEGLRLSGQLTMPRLAGPAAELLASLLAESRPALAEMRLAGGLGGDFELGRDGGAGGGWRLHGELRPQQLTFELPVAELVLAGLSGRLPFDLGSAAGPPPDGMAERTGELRFSQMRLGPAEMAPGPLHFAAAPNRWAFQTPLRLAVAGGGVTVAELLLGQGPDGLLVTGDFAVDGVDLERLTAAFGLASMRGRIDADLGRIRYAGGLLSSAGQARIDVFGGRVRIGRIGLDISDPAYPLLSADIDFEAIDLARLTQTFAFGAMNGIVDGHVHDLRLFGATPVKFSARLESRLEGRRNISVKALNNLSILSQGGLSAALSRGVYRFIDFYRYRKIGIRCELDRDLFHLRGIARPGSGRYLVDGGLLPPRIDIVAPPSAIAFSEMLKRLQRIERAD